MPAVTLGAEVDLGDRAAAFLVHWIRQSCRDESGEPIDDSAAVATLAVADEIEGGGEEPIDLGNEATQGLSAYVLREYLVRGDEELTTLYFALRRYRGDPV